MIALYPGAYKPPHRGHFNVVKSLLDGSYNGSVYNKDNYKETGAELLKGRSNEKPQIDKVIVFVGAGERNGITKEESMSIWEVYSKYLGNVEILDGGSNPMFAAKDYAQANPDQEFVSVTGIRGDEDFVDLRRVTTFKNAPNVQGLALASAPGSGVRATDFRKSILAGNLDNIIDFFPEDLSREEILNILSDLKDKIVAEILSSNLSGFVEGYFEKEDNSIEEITRSVDKKKLNFLYDYISRLIPSNTSINLNSNNIVVTFDAPIIESDLETEPKINCNNCTWSWKVADGGDDLYICHKCGHDNQPVKEEARAPELKEYIASLLEYMLDQKMNITPLPEVKLRKDDIAATNFFGKTAYYDPNNKEIVLYVKGRHNKDIVRSFSHEMVHHMQNMENRLDNIKTQDTTESDKLLEIEKEAYLIGNITFRNWEDSLKNAPTNISEGISKPQLDSIEKYADKLFAKLGIDIEFTKHFLDRANDERNKKPISVAELIGMFKKLYRKHGKPLSKIDNDFDAVVKDFNNDINIPFAIDVTQDGIDMYAKTIMRKKDFKTSTPVYPLQEEAKLLANGIAKLINEDNK